MLTYAEKVVEGGGAALSGQVLQGDLLVAVDDVPVRGLALAQILALVRGQQGSTCVLALSRKAASSTLLSLARGRY
jgi:C-terminal processing protease CtpA/Prc